MTVLAPVQPRVRRGWIVAYVLAMTGVAAGWFGPIQILLPEQAARLAAPGGKEALLALVTAYGAAAALLATPLWGAVSDRLRSRFGRRRPVLVAGALVGVAGLLVLSGAGSAPAMTAGWVLVQTGLSGPLAALAAVLADRVPPEQRGTVGALFGVAQIAGVVLGTAVAVAAGDVRIGYLALAVAVPALVASLVVVHREPPPGPDRAVAAATRPRLTAPFAWVWLIRFLFNLVNALLLVYLYYYLGDRVGVAEPGAMVLVVTVINVLVTAAAAIAGGVLSDRWGRRRGFAAAGAVVLAAGFAVLALVPSLPAVLAAAVLLGAGWGLFVAVDLAIVTGVLPDAGSQATMLGVANIAASLPQLVAPALAGVIVTRLGGYPTLYLCAAAVALTALACLPRLRTVA
ncbi:MFS transporter [Amorphoplanes nipponensis]|uniref:MFS transporter n=1 Tax=Actinoplanes nipponensis TaxID=135950 RepID=A0A919JKQ4_9ACTN|nr:MFS transporter [Actinoplanes nipponensis]GIE48564.1 MFS transporter [Actinoplanes nipponensis]